LKVRKSPRKRILELVRKEPGLTRSEVADRLGITYSSARYWLERLVEKGYLSKKVAWVIRPYMRRVFYYPVAVPVYYRTQFALMFYAEEPRTKTPDPIAEFRVTAVSDVKGKYDLAEFERACIYVGVILAPQTYWIKQKAIVTASEIDEAIDVDELEYSVPVKKRLNYAERYAVFFRSRRGYDLWREKYPYWWLDPTAPLPTPREGDYEYTEDFIKELEEKKIALGALDMRFNNIRGKMESVIV